MLTKVDRMMIKNDCALWCGVVWCWESRTLAATSSECVLLDTNERRSWTCGVKRVVLRALQSLAEIDSALCRVSRRMSVCSNEYASSDCSVSALSNRHCPREEGIVSTGIVQPSPASPYQPRSHSLAPPATSASSFLRVGRFSAPVANLRFTFVCSLYRLT